MEARPTTSRFRATLPALFALGTVLACEAAPPAERPVPPPATASAPASVALPASGSVGRADAGFRSRQHLAEHFEKHGAEFGTITRDEYLRRARELRDAPAGGDVLELRRDDGTISRFDRHSGAFVAFDADGTIRTFFRPNDGEAYFQRQARRRG